jgi:hypothetical protein
MLMHIYRSKKSSKTVRIKAKVTRKVVGIGSPKEVVPLVLLLREKKKSGEDVGALVSTCMATLSG